MLQRPIVVLLVGTSRAGKSALASSLDGHPAMSVWPVEIKLTSDFEKTFTPEEILSIGGVLTSFGVKRNSSFDTYDWPPEFRNRFLKEFYKLIARESIQQRDLCGSLELLGQVLSIVMEKQVPEAVVFDTKIPASEAIILLKRFNRLRLIPVLRDLRSVYLDLRKRQFLLCGVGNFWYDAKKKSFFQIYTEHVTRFGWECRNTISDRRLKLVRHGSLRKSCSGELSTLASWLRVATTWDQMAIPTRLGLATHLDHFRLSKSLGSGYQELNNLMLLVVVNRIDKFIVNKVREIKGVKSAVLLRRNTILIREFDEHCSVNHIVDSIKLLGYRVVRCAEMPDNLTEGELRIIARCKQNVLNSDSDAKSLVCRLREVASIWCQPFPNELEYYRSLFRSPKKLVKALYRSGMCSRRYVSKHIVTSE